LNIDLFQNYVYIYASLAGIRFFRVQRRELKQSKSLSFGVCLAIQRLEAG
jgi:uncharacterized membrane protein